MKLLAAVFFYNPIIHNSIEHIEKYVNSVSCLIIWSNTPNLSSDYYKTYFEGKYYFNKLVFMGQGRNDGLARPINIVMQKMINEGYDALITMDQDSDWVNFDAYVSEIQNNEYASNVFVPNINGGVIERDGLEELSEYSLINSGTLYGREAISKIGFMNENFFVENVDTEYGYRIELHPQVKLYRVRKAILVHNTDDHAYSYSFPTIVSKILPVANRKFSICKYSSTRLYDIVWSMIYMQREFVGDIRYREIKRFIRYYSLNLLLRILLLGPDRFKRLHSYFKGFIDGILNKESALLK